MGVAVGDYNRDSYPDLFVTSYNRSTLYRNNGDGTFTDVTLKSGIATPGWASSAVWFDYDNDGRLDLFVCRFVEFDKAGQQILRQRGHRGTPLLHSPHLSAHPQLAVSQQRGRHVYRRFRRNRDQLRAGQSLGSGSHRHQQRRLDGPLCRQRYRRQFSLGESPRQVQGRGGRERSRLQCRRPRPLRDGCRCSRPRPGRLAGPQRDQCRSGDVLRLSQ